MVLCGCYQKSTITPTLNNISFTAKISNNNYEYIADVLIDENKFNLSVTAPKEIEGYKLTCDKNSITSEFKGVLQTCDSIDFNHSYFPLVLFNVIADAKQKNLAISDNNYVIKDSIDGSGYTFVFSPTGLPKMLEINDFKIQFINVTLK